MRYHYLSFSFPVAVIVRPIVLQAQAIRGASPAIIEASSLPNFQSSTLVKLGTGLTRGLHIGGHLDFSLPVAVGVERQFLPEWAAYANVSSGWRIENRAKARSARDQPSALVS
ncbi:hypothetical protein ABIB60_002937 [Hymenobacter sp. UYP22]